MAYLLDANVFIQGKNLYYGFDICPGFWEWLIQANAGGFVFSIDRVEGELVGLGDDLSTWAGQRGSGFFLKPDNAMLPSLRTVSAWASSQNYEPAAVNLFLQVADYYLVAYAQAHGHIVVTHEISSASTKKIKIPDACIGNSVSCMSPFEMLRRERARFVLP
jgi:glucose dehydrogenase